MSTIDEKLNKALGDWLASWPVPERSPESWQQTHDQIMAACNTRPTSTPDHCFSPPCPQLDEDETEHPSLRAASGGASMSDESDKPRRASLKEIAQRVSARSASIPPASGSAPPPRASTPPRSSVQPTARSSTPPSVSTRAPEAKDSDSGILDLRAARESMASAANPTESAAATVGLFEEEEEGADKLPVQKADQRPASLPPTRSKASVQPLIVGSFVALTAIAAVAILATRSSSPTASSESIPPAAASAESIDRAGAKAQLDQPQVAATVAAAAETDLSTGLPANRPNAPTMAADRSSVAASAPVTPGELGHENPAAKGATPEFSDKASVASSSSSSPGQDSLANAMARAVGGSPDKASEPPAAGASPQASTSHSASVPEIPSQGAIQGAVGAVMGSARACIAGMESPSHAQITFSSDGQVASVSVSGSAAGKPAEGCIVGALKRAKVGPFQRATYSVGFTIRPL